MNRTLLIVIVVVLALGIGTGAAYAVSQALPAPQAAQTPQPGGVKIDLRATSTIRRRR